MNADIEFQSIIVIMKKYSSVLILLVLGSLLSTGAQDRPNVVVILTDDQGWGDLSINGNTNLDTPRIDSLAKEGILSLIHI